MLERECVPERDRVPSLQCYEYPLEEEHGLLLLVGYLSDYYYFFLVIAREHNACRLEIVIWVGH